MCLNPLKEVCWGALHSNGDVLGCIGMVRYCCSMGGWQLGGAGGARLPLKH